ncbi:MAG: hypothetical protein Q7T26_05850 [Dehalococcoidia bacterium]|nr:hypothetical protein [Dehalococcoidia bacterium]
MSYSSESILAPGTRIQDVREFVLLLGYAKSGALKSEEYGQFEEYRWFDATDYRSWTGVGLSIYRVDEERLAVETHTPIRRSYFDLNHQNNTISGIRKRFGGEFATDEGRGRYLRPRGEPPPAPASGCYLAFNRFGHNLFMAHTYHETRDFPNHPLRSADGWKKGIEFLPNMDPRTLANNTLVLFLVAAIEDYFKSTFIALLRYSARKDAVLKSIHLQGEQLLAVSNGQSTVEEQISETLSFQRLSAVCRHFEALDTKLDIAGALRKPYHRRSRSLFESLESLVLSRHEFIHRAALDPTMTDERIDGLFCDLDAAITRVYRRITEHYNWFFAREWNLERLRLKKPPISDNT